MISIKMLSLVTMGLLSVVSLSHQQCLTPHDSVRQVKTAAAESLLQSELQFSMDLLHTVTSLQPDQNIFFSPTSVFKAMLLAYFISANHTENSLKQALHLASDEDKLDVLGGYTLHNYYGKLRSIKSEYRLDSANRLYIDKSVRVQPCFKVLFAEEICKSDFKNNSKSVLKKINSWVSEKTRKVITDFLNDDQVGRNTDLVLVNAAYFKGTWENIFDKEDTALRDFHLGNGEVRKTQFMIQQARFKMITEQTLNAQVVELPYKGGDISMVVVKPTEISPSAIQELAKNINLESLRAMMENLNSTSAYSRYVIIPKFTVDKTLQLTEVLESIGVGDLFQETADLGSLASDGDLSFSEALHKAKLRVDEVGTEAAAVTDFMSNRMGLDERFAADSPFLYFIYDKLSDVILFLGIYNFPE